MVVLLIVMRVWGSAGLIWCWEHVPEIGANDGWNAVAWLATLLVLASGSLALVAGERFFPWYIRVLGIKAIR